jgi:DNA polymerase III sliding clamp (beta) subunit (PCNA family)
VAKYIFDEPLPFEFVISRESAESINIIQPFEYYTDDNFVYFFNDNKDVLCILKKNHKYPEISDLFESDKPNHMINRDELSKLSKVTLSLKTAEQNFVNVSLSNKKIKLASSTSQGQIDQEYEGDEFTGAKGEFIINTDFLLKGIEHCDSFSIKNDVAISFQSDKLKYSVAQAINR